MKKISAIMVSSILAVSTLLSCASCSILEGILAGMKGDSSSSSSTPLETVVPETGTPDKKDLVYGDAIEGYKKTDFTANWIWTKTTSDDSYVAIRKTFTLDKDVEEATMYVSAESKYFLWVNGELTVYDGSTKRGPTLYDSYYDTVTLKNLKKGENTLAFLVAYNGRSGDSSIDGEQELGEGNVQGGLLFEMQAGNQTVKSDANCKVLRLTAYKNRMLLGTAYPNYPQISMLAERNIWYDARDSVGKFMDKNFDDSAWENASLIAKPGNLPFGDLYQSIIPLIAFDDVTMLSLGEYKTTFTKDTTIVLDLPENMQYSAYFELDAPAGKKITYYPDTFQIGNTTSYTFKDTYVTKEGEQSYESYPWRSGSQLILEVESGVTLKGVGYRRSYYNQERVGSFTSSDEDLNLLWEKCANTVDICMRDTYMDCPDRERGPYMGDATNEMDIAYYAFDENATALTKKMILSATAWTGKDGLIPSRAPSFKAHEIPVQSLAFSTAVYNYWMQTGDKETVQAYYTALINYLKVYKMKSNGMVEMRNGEWTWYDWGEAPVDKELLVVCWYYYSLQSAQKMADGLGITADNAFLSERMTSIKSNFRSVYKKAFGYSSTTTVDERVNALAVLTGLASEEDYFEISLILSSSLHASPYMERFVLQALCKMGEYELALNRMKTRYQPMIDAKYSTVWELFKLEEGTYNHGWSAGPLLIMSAEFMGMKPTKAGWASYEIKPENLFDSVSATTDTCKGTISVSYVKEEGKTTFTVQTIDGEGTIRIPTSFGEKVTCAGATIVGVENGYTVLTVNKAGTYTIIAE